MNPGSDEAIEAGCRCPRMDNHYGAGYSPDGTEFVISERCPLHSKGFRFREPVPMPIRKFDDTTDQPACEDKTQ